MMRWLHSLWRGLNYIWVIAVSLLYPDKRRQVREFIALLNTSQKHLGSGDLPALMEFLDRHTSGNPLYLDETYLLRLADAIAAFRAMPQLRHCMRRTILRYSILEGHHRAVSFVVGANRSTTTIVGHAWIQIDGVAFGEYDDTYQTMGIVFRHP